MQTQAEADKRNLNIHKRLNLNLLDDVQRLEAKVEKQARQLDYLSNKLSTAGISPERLKVKNS